MHGPAQESRHLLAIQHYGLLRSVSIVVGHGEDATGSVGSKALVDRQFIAVLVKDFRMDFKNQSVDDKLLFLALRSA